MIITLENSKSYVANLDNSSLKKRKFKKENLQVCHFRVSVNSSLFWREGIWIIVIIAVALVLEVMIFFLISPNKERSISCSFYVLNFIKLMLKRKMNIFFWVNFWKQTRPGKVNEQIFCYLRLIILFGNSYLYFTWYLLNTKIDFSYI